MKFNKVSFLSLKFLTELRSMFNCNVDKIEINFKSNEVEVFVNGKYWATYEPDEPE